MIEIGTEICKTVRILVSLRGWYHYPVTDPTPTRKYVVKLAKSSEMLFVHSTILQQERNDLQQVISARKQ